MSMDSEIKAMEYLAKVKPMKYEIIKLYRPLSGFTDEKYLSQVSLWKRGRFLNHGKRSLIYYIKTERD